MSIRLLNRCTWAVLFVCALYGLVCFMISFFPTKPIVSRVHAEDIVKGPEASFDRVVQSCYYTVHNDFSGHASIIIVLQAMLLVIDSLRADFLISEETMNFTRSLIAEGHAHAFIAEAVVPTVTMPRLKALTSGTIPVFMDVAFNFDASSAFTEDNIVDRAKEAGRTVVFYGDDTWLKLFPTQFDRSEGVTSFFVADTREVDDNVTRRLLPELANSDWGALIAHYLGLDHAGHLTGPHSALTNSKKVEVDQLIATIYKRLFSNPAHKNTLFVVASDHGMNERGNHGGADVGEISSLLVFISPKYKSNGWQVHSLDVAFSNRSSSRAAQVDLAPTLSILLGLPIPRRSVGRILLPPLSVMSPQLVLSALATNAEQLRATFDDVCDDPALRERLQKTFNSAQAAKSFGSPEKAYALYEQFLVGTSAALKEQLTRFDLNRTYSALALLALSAAAMLLLAIASPHTSIQEDPWTCAWACLLMALYTFHSYPRIDPLLMACIAFSGSVVYQFNFHWHGLWRSGLDVWDVGALVMEVTRNFLLLSSSFVEEEHQIYFYLATSFAAFEFVRAFFAKRFSALLPFVWWLVFLRTARSWNSSGNKWLNDFDLAKYFAQYPFVNQWQCSAALALQLLLVSLLSSTSWARSTASTVTTCVWVLAVAPLKLGVFSMDAAMAVLCARLGYAAAFAHLMAQLLPLRSCNLRGVVVATLQFMFVIHRTHNLGLLALVGLAAFASVPDSNSKPLGWVVSLTSLLWLGQASFFGFGNTNSIATIDIGAAYTGLGGYYSVVVALGIFVLMHSGHLLLMPALVGNIQAIQRANPYHVGVRFPFLLMGIKLVGLATYAVVLVLMRHHLFIWSVFAPRLLYLLVDLAWETVRCVTLLLCIHPGSRASLRTASPSRRGHAE